MFSKESAPYVQTKPLHPTQKTEEKNEHLIVRIKVMPNYELESLILSFGENVEILKPELLRENIRMRLKNSLNNYP
jgi:predicted DNA-binding transcriptional regulator YafY